MPTAKADAAAAPAATADAAAKAAAGVDAQAAYELARSREASECLLAGVHAQTVTAAPAVFKPQRSRARRHPSAETRAECTGSCTGEQMLQASRADRDAAADATTLSGAAPPVCLLANIDSSHGSPNRLLSPAPPSSPLRG